MTDDPGEQTTLDANLPEAPHAVHGAECRRRLWQACARATGNRTVAPRRSLRRGRHRDCGRFRCTAPAHHVSLRRTGTGGRLDCRRRAALCLRSLTRTPTLVGGGIRTAAHLYAPPVLWLAAMQAGAWFEWQVRRTPIAYGTNWFYAEMYNEYVREPSGLVLSASVAAAVTASLAAVLGAWIACACLSLRKNAAPRRGRLSNDNRARFSISEHSCLRGPSFTDSIGSPRTRATARYLRGRRATTPLGDIGEKRSVSADFGSRRASRGLASHGRRFGRGHPSRRCRIRASHPSWLPEPVWSR